MIASRIHNLLFALETNDFCRLLVWNTSIDVHYYRKSTVEQVFALIIDIFLTSFLAA